MASLLAQMAAAAQQEQLRPTNKRVVVYAPGRGLPSGPIRQPVQAAPRGPQQRPSGTRPTRSGTGGAAANFAAAEEAYLNSPAAQKQRQQKANQEAEDAAWDEKPWYEKGLGMALGNPVVSNILKPLSVLSTPGKAVVAGIEGLAEHTPLGKQPGWAKALEAVYSPQAGITSLVDTERTGADDRSLWEKVKPDSDYGFGQLLDPDMSPWISRPLGFAGDIATDPFTYVAPGATRAAGALEKGAKLAESAAAVERAAKIGEEAERASKLVRLGEKGGTYGRAAEKLKADQAARFADRAAEAQAEAERLVAEAEKFSDKKVPVHQGRKARAQLIGEIAQHNPELLERYGPELKKAGQRGFNTIRDQALRDALGLHDPALRFMGQEIPKTRGLIEKGAELGGFVRAGLDKTPYGAVGRAFAPQGLEEPLNVLTRGAKGDTLKSATTVRIQNLMRRGAGEFEGRGNKALTDMVKQLKGIGGEEEIRALFRQAETDPNPNVLNKFFGEDMPKLYEKIAGRKMHVGRDKATYVPHMHTPEGRRFLATLDDDTLKSMMGDQFSKDDLLESSKFLEHSRKLTPETVGVPKEFDIKGRGSITLTDGTVDEINEQLGQLFPEFKGKFYEDDPVRIGEAYVSSVARQAGRDMALNKLADSKNPLVREITGDLLADVEKRNEFLRRNPVVEKVKAGYRAGERLVPAKDKGEMPVTPHDDMFAVTKHLDESKKQADYLMKEGKQYVADIGKDVNKSRSTLAENLKGLRTTLKDGLRKKTDDAERQIRALNVQLERVDGEIKKMGPLTSENMDDLVATHQTIESHITDAKAEIRKINDRYGKKIPRDQARVDKELRATVRHLEDQRTAVEAAYRNSSHEIRAEARARKTALEAPLDAAEDRVRQAEAAVGPRPQPREAVQRANQIIRTGFESEDAFEAERQLWAAELKRMRDEGVPIYRTTSGRITPESAEELTARVLETKKTTPPVPDVPTPPPTATVEPAMAPTPEDQLREAMAKQAKPAEAAAPEAPPVVNPQTTAAERRAQGVKTTNKMVTNAQKRLDEAVAALTEGIKANAPPEDMRKLAYGVEQAEGRLKEARTFQQDAVRDAAAATEAAVPEAPPAPVERRHIGGISKKNKLTDGSNTYSVSDGVDYYTIRKNDDGQWIVRTNNEVAQADNGYRSLQKAGEAIDSGKHRAAEAAPEVPVAAVPEVAPPAPVTASEEPPGPPDTKLVRNTDGAYRSENGWEIVKEPKGWHATFHEDDYGYHPNLKQAKATAEHQQGIMDKIRAKRLAKTQGEAPAAVAAAEEVAAPAAAVAEEAEPSAGRITRKWQTKEVHGRDIEVLTGPDEGWTIEPFEESLRGPPSTTARGHLGARQEGPRAPWVLPKPWEETQGARRIRYVALHDTDDALRGRSFASAREAKMAVESELRQRSIERTAQERMDAYLASRRFGETGQVAATYENLSGVRTDFPTPPPPEQAAANMAAAQAVPNLERPVPGTTMGPNQFSLTEEGAALEAMRPPKPRPVDQYNLDFAKWQETLERSKDPSLTQAERRKAAAEARTMGGQFTQTTGKHYNRHAAQKIWADELDWQSKVDNHPDVIAARANYAKVQQEVDDHVEAIVYLKHNAPDPDIRFQHTRKPPEPTYTRLQAGSLEGFAGEGGERVAVPVEPPTQGEVPLGSRERPVDGEWHSNYSQGERDADRAVLDSGIDMLMMPENRAPYSKLRERSEAIAERLDNAATNQERLAQLDEAAQQAYTQGVKEADAAVLDAKRLEFNAEGRHKDYPGPGTEQAWRDAQAHTKQVIADQTDARRTWMEADKAWKAAVAERQEYIDTAAKAANAERSLIDAFRGEGSNKFVDAAKRGESVPLVPTKKKGEWVRAPEDIQKLSKNLTEATQRLNEMDAAGRTFLDETEHRRLVGELNGIDDAKREIVNQVLPGGVKTGEEVLPQRNFQQERMAALVGGGDASTENALSAFESTPPTGAPPAVTGSGNDLQARAFAESFSPTEPGSGGTQTRIVGKRKERTEQLVDVPGPGVQPYRPVPERQRIAELEQAAADVGQSEVNTARQAEHKRLGGEIRSAQVTAENRNRTNELTLRAEQNEKLAPLKDRVQTYSEVNKALDEKATTIAQRDKWAAERKVIMDNKITAKADLAEVAGDIEKVAKQNPDLFDNDLAKTEGVLHDAAIEAERLADNDLTGKQVQNMINKVADPRDNSLDIMLTTTGKNWKMLYDTNGAKRAILQKDDIILQADLHKMFTNLYEIKKDRVLFGRTLNAFTNLFKTYATLSPGFHVRNALSAIFMNATDGVAMKTQFSAARIWKEYMGAEDSEKWLAEVEHLHGFTGDEIRGAMSATHGTGAGGRFTEAGFAQKLDTGHWSDKLGRLQSNRLTRFSQRVGESVEGSVRLAMGLDSMRAGDNVESAIQRINRIHFDYGEISTLDANMKRLIPFWTFMSRNMPMQVSQMWTHPQVYLGYQRFVKNFSATNEEYTPEYWTKAGAWNTGLKVPGFIPESFGGGLPISVQPDLGFTRLESDLKDYEDFLSGDRLGGVLSAGNPLYTAPLEYATRTDLFTGQHFEEGETVPVKGIGGIPWRMLAKVLGKESDGEVDAAFMNAIRAVNPIQDRETRLLPQITGGDPEATKRQPESWARFLGAPVRTLTPKQQDNEFFRRYYDQLDAAKLEQKRQQRKAG